VIPDEALALAMQQGRTEEFEMLVDRYYRPLLGYLYRLTGGSPALAEDLVQETFLRVLRGIGLYSPSRPFKPWLYTIATNIARNYQRRADTRYTEAVIEDMDYADEALLPEDAVLVQDEAQHVMQALAALPEHQREVLVLFYYEDLSQADIAEILKIPVGTVKSRLSLGLKRLREKVLSP
jgi:RNA polymerase sigma-70 factor (ECF subfamily)